MAKIKSSKIVLVTHYRIYSAAQALRDYIRREGCENFLYVSHPLPLKVEGVEDDSYFELSKGKKIIEKKIAKRNMSNILITSSFDFFLTFFWSLKNGKTDLFIGVDNLNAIVGVLLKKLGRVDRVVYYTIDYFPRRFENKILNRLYHLIDKICVTYSDETWNVSNVMVSARRKNNNMYGVKFNRQYTVPIGIWYDKAPRKHFSEIDKKKIIFVGHLLDHMGVDLVIRAMSGITSKIPDVKLEIIGGGEEEKKLKELSKELKVDKNVKFWGWVRDRDKLEKIMSDGAIGLATFNTDILDEKVKNADPGKIKDYMLLGMPVIVTDAISTASAISKAKSGIVINYKASELTAIVVQLLQSDTVLKEYRENALKYVAKFDYNLIFKKNLERILAKNKI